MRRFLLLLALLLAVPGVAQDLHSTPLFLRYDITNGSFVFGDYLGSGGSPFGTAITGPGRAKTVGSSTTVTENVSGENPFSVVAIGDVMTFIKPADVASGAVTAVVVTAHASDASITVDTAVDLTGGVTWRYFKASQGTGATVGWVNVGQDRVKTWSWNITTINATNIKIQIQCIDDYVGAVPVIIYPPITTAVDACSVGTFTATTPNCKFGTDFPYAACRIGMNLTGDAGVQSVTMGYEGERRH